MIRFYSDYEEMKKSTYKLCLVSFLVIAFAVILSGCKGDPKESEETQTTVTGQPTVEPTKVPEEVDTQTAEGENAESVVAYQEMEGPAAHYGTLEVAQSVIYEENFEDGQTDFVGRGDATAEIVTTQAQEGTSSLFISGRKSAWNGTTVEMTELLPLGKLIVINAYVYYDEGPDTVQIDCKLERNNSEYIEFASVLVKKGEWTELIGDTLVPFSATNLQVYFETSYSGTDLIDFYIDDLTISQEITAGNRGEIPSLKEAYQNRFSMGVAVTANEIGEKREELIAQQFNSLTPGNELKADSILDHATSLSDPKYDESPAVKFDRVKPIMEFAQEAGIPVRGHTLVWHSQVPRWFFTEGYSDAANAPFVTKELMLKRMENYIRQVLEYTQTNYPGVIYAWDVVNEAVNTGDGVPDGLRSKDSLWYQVVGPEFIEKAFEYARKYADPKVKLFYNDYNTEDKARMVSIIKIAKGLQEKGLIDGIGLQSHIGIDSPSIINIDESIRKYGELGLEIQITELDMGLPQNTDEAFAKQATRYKRLFTFLNNIDDSGAANITNVTFWGLSDDVTWLSKPGQPSYPLLFDKYLIQKPAFWGVLLSPDIDLY